ncbi:TolC family protein [Rhodonellum sp.]|uniref:TolC family protein n=1 Tax=Rhodonellum sp. TaxID=2231180 RepID=UPI002715F506|nr:TolC family protein [Rhodonellum sp.]MDO9550963.1 TolC family protein [Rhodonellum sp.]
MRRIKPNAMKSFGYFGLAWVIFLFGFNIPVVGQTKLDTYIQLASDQNPAVKASFTQYQAALEKVNQVGSLSNPELTMGVFLKPMETLMGNQRTEISLMQMFPWFGMLRTQKDEATLMAQAKYEEFRTGRNLLVYQVKATYYQIHQLEFEMKANRDNLEILQTMERLAIIKYQGGNVGQAAASVSGAVKKADSSVGSTSGSGMGMGGGAANAPASSSSSSTGMTSMGESSGSGKLTDVLRLQIQIKALESELRQLEANRPPLISRFNSLLNQAPKTVVELESEMLAKVLSLDAEAFLDSVLVNNPMVKMLEAEGLAYRKQAEMAKLEGKPMFGLGVNYMVFTPRPESGTIGGMDGMGYMPSGMGQNMVMPMVTLSLPIYRKKFKAMEKEAIIWRESNALQKEDIENTLTVQVEEITKDIRNTELRVELLREQIALTQQTLEIMITAYATESSSFEEILTVQRELLDYRLSLANTIIEQYMGYAEIEQLLGY